MRFEHFGINVPDPASMAAWYVKHFDMRIVRSREDPPYMHFLADDTGRVTVELYCNTTDAVPDYAEQHPLRFHWGFVVDDPEAVRDRLTADGASVFVEEPFDDGTLLVMMRDPWGVPLQLCKRAEPFA